MDSNLEVIDRRRKMAEPETVDAPAAEEVQSSVILAELDRVYDEPVPIFDRVLIKQGAKESTWGSERLVIPEAYVKAPNMGVVVATSQHYIVDGKQFEMVELVKPGDVVTFSAFNTETIERDGEAFVLCSIFDVKLIERVHFALGVSGANGA